MFTGIVTAIGTVASVEQRGDLHVRIACPYDPESIAIGASIACSGVCLTVVERGGVTGDSWFAVDVSGETVSRSAPGPCDELGGHIVTGHVDCVGELVGKREEGDSIRLTIRAPADYAPFIALKGSITVDGVSLTVNGVDDLSDGSCTFTLNIIPHTGEVTTLGALAESDRVNLEIDVLARYLKRMQALAG